MLGINISERQSASPTRGNRRGRCCSNQQSNNANVSSIYPSLLSAKYYQRRIGEDLADKMFGDRQQRHEESSVLLLSERGDDDDEDDPLSQFDKAIVRMESETDAILDSIREDFSPPITRKSRDVDVSASFYPRMLLLDDENNEDDDDFDSDSHDDIGSDDVHHRNPAAATGGAKLNLLDTKDPVEFSDDDDDDDDDDDEIRDEIQRLNTVTEALRQDLDSQNVESMNTALEAEDDSTAAAVMAAAAAWRIGLSFSNATSTSSSSFSTTTLMEPRSSISTSTTTSSSSTTQPPSPLLRKWSVRESIIITSLTVLVWAIVIRLIFHVSHGEFDSSGQLLPPFLLRWM